MATRPERDAIADVSAAGSSIVGIEGALRARDVSRPDPADFEAAAEQPVRRTSWRPPAPTRPARTGRAGGKRTEPAPPA